MEREQPSNSEQWLLTTHQRATESFAPGGSCQTFALPQLDDSAAPLRACLSSEVEALTFRRRVTGAAQKDGLFRGGAVCVRGVRGSRGAQEGDVHLHRRK